MANSEQLSVLAQGVEAWNEWRQSNPDVRPDLSRTDLTNRLLMRADLSFTDMHGCKLTCANLMEADFRGANLDGADLLCANLTLANLRGAQMRLTRLVGAVLVETELNGADLSGSHVYGVSAWNAKLEGTIQRGLVVTAPGEPEVTVDHLEMAQFVDMVLHNENIRNALNTLTSKVVLILGRFSAERKPVLDALREALRHKDYAPVIFDFEQAPHTTAETISTLAHMAHYVIADLSDPACVLQELQAIVPHSPSVVVQPILPESQNLPGMYDSFEAYPWVLEPFRYRDKEHLLSALENVIATAESKAGEIKARAEQRISRA